LRYTVNRRVEDIRVVSQNDSIGVGTQGVFVSHDKTELPELTSSCASPIGNWFLESIRVLAVVLAFAFTVSSRAQQEQQAQMAEDTSQNHYAEAQMALLTFLYFMDKCQKGDDGACTLAAMAYNQYLALMQTGSRSRTTADLSATVGKKSDKGPTINGATVNGATVNDRTIGDALEKLKKKGVEVGPNGTMSVNGGPLVPASSFGTESGMKAAGLSAQQVADLKAKMDEMKEKSGNGNKALAGDIGGGGGGRSTSAPEPAEAAAKGDAGNIGKAGVSGLSKNLGNDKIGVAGDDIFKMISRRYKVHERSLKE
jgi:hypothetical protein